ncbi:MAG TPA: acetylxylan esterase, partial [Sphingobacteriaceae bacterium]
FPVILEPVGSSGSAISTQTLERIKRGYMVCQYDRRDAETMGPVYVENDMNQLEWWAWNAGRCVDYLYTRSDVDKNKIAVAGHSRGGKSALLSAVMDERIAAVIPSHPGSGAGTFNLWRYGGEKFGGETLEISTRQFPYWNNNRMRFFIGRENKMPFDSHFLVGLIAPRACLISTGILDGVGEVWGDQQSYLESKKVYRLLGRENALGFYASPGGHEVTPEMRKDYLDWLDMQFGKKPFAFKENLVYSYTFDEWKKATGENINVNNMPEYGMSDILNKADGKKIKTPEEWEAKADLVKRKIKDIIGTIPDPKTKQIEPAKQKKAMRGGDLQTAEIPVDDKVIAHLTWQVQSKAKVPVVIYLHAYLDSRGWKWHRGYSYDVSVGERLAKNGFLAVEFDQFGYGLRNLDANIDFFKKNKDMSGLGVMMQDVSKVIDAISQLDWVDKNNIVVSGYSLGGMVGLYSAAFDNRIKAVASISGFGSMRMDSHGVETEGLTRYAYNRPTIPKLGFFVGNEKKIPYDYHELLGLIAPRPVFILAPLQDQDWVYEDVEKCYEEALKVYDLYGKKDNLVLNSPNDFNRFSIEYQEKVINWLTSLKK